MKLHYFLFTFLAFAVNANAQSGSMTRNNDVVKMPEVNQSNVRNIIRIPDFDGYHTMKCDFHIHTVFSDGQVWPAVRVKEAWRQGLDAIAITDHIEVRPRKDILTGDHNESYNIARREGDNVGMIVIKATEITRSKPFGHFNALFITDANELDVKDEVAAINAAVKQKAFILWNHPGWPDNKSTLYPIHEQLIKENKIHGVEVLNESEYYPVAFDWCKKYNLAFIGNSDIHGLIEETYGSGVRPINLVFTTERSENGIRNALFAGRTLAYFNGNLAGNPQYMIGLIEASLKIKVINREKNTVEVANLSDITYKMSCNETMFIFPAGKIVRVNVPKTGTITVLNCHTGLNENLTFNAEDIRF